MTAFETESALMEPGEPMVAPVCGAAHPFVQRFGPLVRTGNVALDLSAVERLDAAGVGALITLYCNAVQAGYSFTVRHARPHVREVLALVGLDRILILDSAETASRRALVRPHAA